MRGWLALVALAALASQMAAVRADPGAYAPSAVTLSVSSGTGYADALAQAQNFSKLCSRNSRACTPTVTPPAKLVPQIAACGGSELSSVWRLGSELQDTAAQSALLEQRASSREIFDCIGPSCLAILPTSWPKEHDTSVTSLSVCRVQQVGGVAGPPNSCTEILKRSKVGTLLLRGKVGEAMSSCSMGLRDFDAVFKGRGSDVASIRSLVKDVLHAKPFQLSVMEDGAAIVGTRAYLASAIVTGWREWVTVRVEIDTRNGDAGVSIFTTMLVSKQASAGRDAWSPPSEPQESQYLAALREALSHRGGTLVLGVGR